MPAILKSLTPAGIQALIHQLNVDLAAVPTSAQQRPTIVNLISQLQNELPNAPLPPDNNSWANIKANFAQLAPLLKAVLVQATGACLYVGGCIQTTADECTVLGGTFEQNKPCPPQ
jgi:hypothetical protein